MNEIDGKKQRSLLLAFYIARRPFVSIQEISINAIMGETFGIGQKKRRFLQNDIGFFNMILRFMRRASEDRSIRFSHGSRLADHVILLSSKQPE
jgi:hypothetical protein